MWLISDFILKVTSFGVGINWISDLSNVYTCHWNLYRFFCVYNLICWFSLVRAYKPTEWLNPNCMIWTTPFQMVLMQTPFMTFQMVHQFFFLRNLIQFSKRVFFNGLFKWSWCKHRLWLFKWSISSFFLGILSNSRKESFLQLSKVY